MLCHEYYKSDFEINRLMRLRPISFFLISERVNIVLPKLEM